MPLLNFQLCYQSFADDRNIVSLWQYAVHSVNALIMSIAERIHSLPSNCFDSYNYWLT